MSRPTNRVGVDRGLREPNGDSVFGDLEQSLAIGIGGLFVTSSARCASIAGEIRSGGSPWSVSCTLVAVHEVWKFSGRVHCEQSSGRNFSSRVKPNDGAVLFTSSQSARDKADVLKAVGACFAGPLGLRTPHPIHQRVARDVHRSFEALRDYSQAQALEDTTKSHRAISFCNAARSNFGRAYAGWLPAPAPRPRRSRRPVEKALVAGSDDARESTLWVALPRLHA
jgi:hypothetical protein